MTPFVHSQELPDCILMIARIMQRQCKFNNGKAGEFYRWKKPLIVSIRNPVILISLFELKWYCVVVCEFIIELKIIFSKMYLIFCKIFGIMPSSVPLNTTKIVFISSVVLKKAWCRNFLKKSNKFLKKIYFHFNMILVRLDEVNQ